MIKAILAIWVLFLTAALLGWGAFGLVILTGYQEKLKGGRQLPCLLLLGLFIVTAQALVANFWFPLTEYAGIYSIGVGLLFLLGYYRKLVFEPIEGLSLVAAVVWVVWGMPFDGLFSDAALYHLQSEQWIANSPLLWGLANIQTRFGFDSTWLIFVSATRINLAPMLSPWMHAIVADMMIRAFIFWWLLIGVNASIKNGHRMGLVFYGFGFLFLSLLLWRMKEAGTDNPANMIAIALWLIVYEMWGRVGESQTLQYAIAAIAAAGLILTSKLSILPLVLMVAPVLFVYKSQWKSLVPSIIVASLFLVLWISRNFVLTGCLVYPAAVTCTDVPWGVGADTARSEAFNITTFARIHIGPGIALRQSMESVENFTIEWFIKWMKYFPGTYYFRVTFFAVLIGVFGWVAWGRKQGQKNNSNFLFYSILIGVVTFFYWLVMGPDPRFSWAIFYIISVAAVCFVWMRSSGGLVKISTELNYSLIIIIIFVGAMMGCLRRDEINMQRYSTYQLDSFKYRGIQFYVAQLGNCGDRMPCVADSTNLIALDKVIGANKDRPFFSKTSW